MTATWHFVMGEGLTTVVEEDPQPNEATASIKPAVRYRTRFIGDVGVFLDMSNLNDVSTASTAGEEPHLSLAKQKSAHGETFHDAQGMS